MRHLILTKTIQYVDPLPEDSKWVKQRMKAATLCGTDYILPIKGEVLGESCPECMKMHEKYVERR